MSDAPRLGEDLLSAFVDGELDDAQRAAVQARLERDAAWRHILEDVTVARAAVRDLPEREPPSGFWLRVLTSVAEVAESDRTDADLARAASGPAAVVPITRASPRRSPRWAAMAAAAVAVAVGVAVAAPEHHQRVSPSLPALVDSHAAASSLQSSDPLSNLAPAAVPVGFPQP
jgi:anti-sigma factor RsiW